MVNPQDVKIGRTSCPLCHLYNESSVCSCVGCPIFEATTLRSCRGTPYKECVRILSDLREFPLNQRTNSQFGDSLNERLRDEWKRNAQAMIDFMKRLIPADCNPNGETVNKRFTVSDVSALVSHKPTTPYTYLWYDAQDVEHKYPVPARVGSADVCGFSTEEAAAAHAEQFIKDVDNGDYVFLVYRLNDKYSYRPKLEKIFRRLVSAENFIANATIDNPYRKIQFDVNIKRQIYGYVDYKEFEVRFFRLED